MGNELGKYILAFVGGCATWYFVDDYINMKQKLSLPQSKPSISAPSIQPSRTPAPQPSLEMIVAEPDPIPSRRPALKPSLVQEIQGKELVDIFETYQIEKRYEKEANELYKRIYKTVTRAYLGNDACMPNILATTTDEEGFVSIKRMKEVLRLVNGPTNPNQYDNQGQLINAINDAMRNYQ